MAQGDVDLEKITNFRELGGYRNKNKQMVKKGLLYRSGQLFELDDAQKRYLTATVGIQRIIDMRSADERAQFPDTTLPGAAYTVLDILKDATTNDASLGHMITEQGDVRENMLATYEQLAMSDSAQAGYHAFIRDLLAAPEPTVFHCFAGKDRTGVGAAIILKLLAVPDETIMADYLLTNQERKTVNQMILADLKKQGVPASQLQTIAVALKVDAAYLEHYFQVIDTKFGSFDQYLRQGLQLTDADVDTFQGLYLQG
ncbi:protein tyrosine serine phosphatase [Lacticaseibacillus zeae DSM 20178 = KCTC 3804]|uniref:Protein tyrosine serine phosphatase n=1 Tax=Lacticaseibacillus zeae DSM 20178 = KCTC 3804 TaxID=1423816 RepID=A0A0R1EUK7_LACZE|nr:protein tyrosine serine phosphatase [Lacticaseibacillus zeae DSM 20178 = KCTC 3804]